MTTAGKTLSKSLDTIVEDIYAVAGSDSGAISLSDELLEALGADLQDLMKMRLTEPRGPSRLRLSAVGKPTRQLWYDINSDLEKEVLPGAAHLKFMFGDLWELVILFLAEAAGHEVTHKQGEVELAGVTGHCDAIIDGVVVDVKSASKIGFRKFANGTLPDDDPFGYMEQLASYCTAYGGLDGAFLAVEKESGKLALLRYSFEELQQYAVEERIEYLKEVLNSPELPERCYEPVPEGKSGNLALGTNCSYCPFKHECWSDANNGLGLRTFLYSDRPKHLVHVAKEPRVMEVTI